MIELASLVSDNFDIWTSAIAHKSTTGRGDGNRISLYGVDCLRTLILDLAVRGKLVPQDPNDEPASELLKRIAAEKARLIKAGEIRKEEPLPDVGPDEMPYEAPRGWEWVRIRKVTSDRGQMVPNQNFTYIDVTAINKEVGRIEGAKVTSAGDAPSRARKIVRKGDVLYSCVRPYLLNVAVVETDISPLPIASTAFAVLNGFGLVQPKYQWIVLRSSFMVACVEEKMRGQAYPAINDFDFALLPLPLPPLAEQGRIVAKVDELMSLCDTLEEESKVAMTAHQALVGILLVTLTSSTNGTDLAANWMRIKAQLDTLFITETSIDSLKQSILKLAVRGKLVPQDPNDEPASELLKRIAAEKARLIKAGDVRKSEFDPVTAEEIPFLVPTNWTWTRLGSIGDWGSGSTPPRGNSNFYGGGITWLKSGELNDNRQLAGSEETVTQLALVKGSFRINQPGDVLIAMYGATIGKTAILAESAVTNQAVCGCTPFAGVFNQFLFQFLLSQREQFHSASEGGAQPNISKIKIVWTPFPLPPLAEQRRIVAKVDELMSLCDTLKSLLAEAATTQKQLADALVEAAA